MFKISPFFWQKFSFSSRTRKQISTFLFSLLETRDVDSIFLFLFSIWLFGISSMPRCHRAIEIWRILQAVRIFMTHSDRFLNSSRHCVIPANLQMAFSCIIIIIIITVGYMSAVYHNTDTCWLRRTLDLRLRRLICVTIMPTSIIIMNMEILRSWKL